MKKSQFLSFLVLVALLASSVATAAPLTTNETTMPKSAPTGSFGRNEVLSGKSPTTGLDSSSEYRPVLVQVSNAAGARPHLNMSEADIVYESILWGPGHTRYTLLFNDNHPEVVASIRSTRQHMCAIREEWDCPYLFWGGQSDPGTSVSEFFQQYGTSKSLLFDATGKFGSSSKVFYRMEGRISPHNAAVHLAEFVRDLWPKNEDGDPYESKSRPYKFSSEPSRGSDTAVEVHVVYDETEYYPHYTYNAASRVYERWYNGEEQYDGETGKRIEAANVIVQYAETKYANNIASRPQVLMVNGGIMHAFIDGRHIQGTWERRAMNERTVFLDVSGEEITLLPGKTFIQIIPTSWDFTYVRADGEEVVTNIGSEVPDEAENLEIGNLDDLDKMEDE